MSLLLDALRKAEAAKQAQQNTAPTAWERSTPPHAPVVDNLPPLPELGISSTPSFPPTEATLNNAPLPLPDLPALTALSTKTEPIEHLEKLEPNPKPAEETLIDTPDLHPPQPDQASAPPVVEETHTLLEFTRVSLPLPPSAVATTPPPATPFPDALSLTPVEAPSPPSANQLTDLLDAPLPTATSPTATAVTPKETPIPTTGQPSPTPPPPFNPTAHKSESEKQALAKTLLSAKKITPANPAAPHKTSTTLSSHTRRTRNLLFLAGGMSLGALSWFGWQYYQLLGPGNGQSIAQNNKTPPTGTALNTSNSNATNPAVGQLAMSTSLQALPANQKVITPTNSSEGSHKDSQSPTLNSLAVPTPALVEASPTSKPSAPRRPNIRGRNDAIQITHTPNAVNENPLLLNAWQHYQQGELGNAKRLYQQVLQNDRQNVDATLGLAAIAHSQGNTSEAEQLYRRALLLEPRNTTAQAGLTALNPGADPTLGEAKLKQLLQQQPEAAHLWFALGNYHVNQRQWPEAQQAYFKAVSQDPQQPDYVYNLAVALDHLSQSKAALPYYERAVQLANTRHAQFNLAQAQRRIQDLRD